jgi:hypothetical protein
MPTPKNGAIGRPRTFRVQVIASYMVSRDRFAGLSRIPDRSGDAVSRNRSLLGGPVTMARSR